MLFIIEVGSNKLKKKTVSKTGKKWSSSMGFDSYRKTYYALKSLKRPRKWTGYFGMNK